MPTPENQRYQNGEDQALSREKQDRGAAPLLAASFDALTEGRVAKPELASVQDFFSSPEYRKHCYEETRKAWLYQFDEGRVAECLGREPNSEDLQYLRRTRKFGSVLLNAQRFLGAPHRPQKNLKHFIYDLGQYNDLYWLPARHEAVATILKTQNTWHSLGGDAVLEYASTENFHQYSAELLGEIQTSLSARELFAKDLHLLRKKVRRCANLAQVPAAEHIAGSPQWVFGKIDSLSNTLASAHDEGVGQPLPTEEEYSHLRVALDPSWGLNFREVSPYFKKIVGLNSDGE